MICSAGANSAYDGKLAYVPALEDVLVWDIKKGQMVRCRRVSHALRLTQTRRWPCGTKRAIAQKSLAFDARLKHPLLRLATLMAQYASGTPLQAPYHTSSTATRKPSPRSHLTRAGRVSRPVRKIRTSSFGTSWASEAYAGA